MTTDGHARTLLRGLTGMTAAIAIAVAVAACGGGGVSASQGRAAAVKARGQVLPGTRALYQKIYSEHIGWAFSISANYLPCVKTNSTTQVAYHNYLTYVNAFKGVASASFQQRILALVRASGWKSTVNNQDKPSGHWDSHYDITKGPVKGDLALAGRTALLRFSSPCFDAGPAADSLGSRGGYDIPVPHPTVSPSGG